MMDWDPKVLLGAGCLLLLLGFALPVLMIIQIIESTFFLNFLAYSASVLGLVLGILGAIFFALRGRRK